MTQSIDIICPLHTTESEELQILSSGHLQAKPNERYDRSHYPMWTFETVISGKGDLWIQDQYYPCTAGDSYILPPNQDHAYQADAQDPWSKRYVNCTGKLIHRLASFHGTNRSFYYPNLDISTELKLIHTYLGMNFHDVNPRCAPVIHRIIQRLGQPKETQRPPDFISNAWDFIKKNFQSKINVSTVAQHVHCSEAHLIREFKKQYGLTPTAYLIRSRMLFAKALVENTNLPIKAIAEKLCYADEYYFSNAFKKSFGHSPRHFR